MSKREQKVKEMSHSVSLQVNRKLHFFSRVNEGGQLLPPMIKKKNILYLTLCHTEMTSFLCSHFWRCHSLSGTGLKKTNKKNTVLPESAVSSCCVWGEKRKKEVKKLSTTPPQLSDGVLTDVTVFKLKKLKLTVTASAETFTSIV